MHLYEILPTISKLSEMAEDDKELKIYLDGAKLTLNEKIDNIVKFERGLVAGQEAIDIEIRRLSGLKAQMGRKANNLRDYVSFQMKKNGINKIETDIAKLSFRKSETVEITDRDLIPGKFIKTRMTETIDKMAIKKEIKDGKKVKGAEVKKNSNLQIK